ncbi:MAG: hypothetical protein KBT34_09880 [Prevotella sp.]|nr:hypothetical protein [Candidatus Prevotella equi]
MANEVLKTAENNLIKNADLATVRQIDFVSRFGYSTKKLMELLGVTRMIPKQAGTVLKRHTVTGSLVSGAVAEGDIIPLSKYSTADVPIGEITLNKWRKATSAEAILDKGFDQAVGETTDKMLQDIQNGIKADLISSLTISGQPTATGEGTQAALANAWGKLANIFENDSVELVFFMNPLDIADYLGKAAITVQNAFGFQYVENFLGLGTVVMNSAITAGTFFATAKENIVAYYVPANESDLAKAFDFTSDETGLIAIHEYADYDRLTADDTVLSGIKVFADMTAGVIKGTITAPLGE